MLCTTTVLPSRTKEISRSSSGRWVSLPDEQPVHRNMFKLAFLVLVKAAGTDVADALSVQGIFLKEMCQEEICM